ncbi:luciferase domain-containing protein [Haladaptatus caseinilyticus]|uniref:luciferase domain-containing protein n=1 Tax=Haladaptatus caseinilyticus TaxID=2993314 RepID=UPI00224A686C|nr:luciferase family protein [Haladaptatus caseinilyticus]
MTEAVDRIVAEASNWDGIEAGEHRFGGTEFRLGPREVGHVHQWGILDIAFPRRVRDQLVSEGKTGPHHIYPESGWTTFRIEASDDVDDALWLLRLSYLSHAKSLQQSGVGGALSDLDVDRELADLEPGAELQAVL